MLKVKVEPSRTSIKPNPVQVLPAGSLLGILLVATVGCKNKRQKLKMLANNTENEAENAYRIYAAKCQFSFKEEMVK